MRTLFLIFALSLVARSEETGVLIYGATPAGIAAALAAADDGEHVVLAEPSSRVGGLITNGLTHADFRTFEGFTGAFLDFTRRVEGIYRQKHGPDSAQVRKSLRGTQTEPRVNLLVLEEMLAAQPRVQVWRGHTMASVKRAGARIESVLFADAKGVSREVTARFFIDGSYEGDLMAAAGVKYRVGREARGEYGESLAPEQADTQVQGYNFRLTMTTDPANRVAPSAPEGYRREDFAGVLPLLESGRIKRIFLHEIGGIFKAQKPSLPNGKFDINDVSGGSVRLSLSGENYAWPDADAAERARIFKEHLRWNVGLLFFLQNDAAVPARMRDEAKEWGWCKDEYPENAHLPLQLYVREARRMAGAVVFTERDTDHAPGDARAVLHRDAIAMGDYGPNCHGTGHERSRFGGRHTGEFYKPVVPYQVPYGVLVPREVENLLVPVAASASHVGFCALRMEPIWMSLGQAAGYAAHLALRENIPAHRVSVAALQSRLHSTGAATIYVSDVLPGHADFAAVQWWATAGGLHGLAPMPTQPGQRGKQIVGQYYEAFPGHTAALDQPLDASIAARWSTLAADLGLSLDALPVSDGRLTRGEWLRKAWTLHAHKRAR